MTVISSIFFSLAVRCSIYTYPRPVYHQIPSHPFIAPAAADRASSTGAAGGLQSVDGRWLNIQLSALTLSRIPVIIVVFSLRLGSLTHNEVSQGT